MTARLLKDPATINSRIFVGHLQTEEMNKLEFEEHFSKYGTVVGSLINRGFGFVQFEEEQSALKAIQNENGSMFKGRRIDVRPAKKDTAIGVGGDGPGNMGKPQGNNQFGSGNTSFGSGNDSFSGGNQSFGAGNQSFPSGNQNFSGEQFSGAGGPNRGSGNQNRAGGNDHFGGGNQNRGGGNDQFGGGNQNRGGANDQFAGGTPSRGIGNDQFAGGNQNQGGGNDQFGGGNQNRGNDQFGSGNQNRGAGNDQFGSGSQNRSGENEQFGAGIQNRGGGNDQFGGANQNRGGVNQNRGNGNQNNQGGNLNQGNIGGVGGGAAAGGGGGGGGGNGGGVGGNGNARQRGVRGGKNRNKNRDGGGGGGNNSFRDRSPLMGKGGRDWDMNKSGDRYDDHRGGGYGRDSFGDRGYDDYKGGMRDSHPGFGPLSGGADYPPPAVAEKNDCEIIVVSKLLTEYAEAIEMRLKKLGLTVDLLFPNEDVPLSRVLGNIASRGCLYAVVVTHINQEHRSLTLNILHGLPQEHRNMPVEDAITLIARDFGNYRAGGARTVPLNAQLASDRHPDAVQVLLNMLADNRQLTVLQYDRVIKYLEVKREEQVQIELGDPKDLPAVTQVASDPKQAELQSRILNILNSNKPAAATGPTPSPVPAPAPVQPASWGAAPATTAPPSAASTGVPPSPLLNDPTVQKALDSLLQGNLLKNIGDQQPPSSAPLFAAFSNMGRF